MKEMWVWNVLTWNVTTVLTMQVAMITMLGMCLSRGPHPLLSSTFKDQRVVNRPVLWLLNQTQSTGIGLPRRPEGSNAGISNIQLIYCVISAQVLLPVLISMFSSGVKTPRTRTDTHFNKKVLVSQNSQILVMHSKTCFASLIKIHGCQLHLQLYVPANHCSTMTLYTSHV